MSHFVIPVLFTVEADSYEEAPTKTKSWAKVQLDYHEEYPQACSEYSVPEGADYEHDDCGQRVLYLHPENKSAYVLSYTYKWR